MNEADRNAIRAAAAALRTEAATRAALAAQLEALLGDAVLPPPGAARSPQPAALPAGPAAPTSGAGGGRKRIDREALAKLLEDDVPVTEIARRLGATDSGVRYAIRQQQSLGA